MLYTQNIYTIMFYPYNMPKEINLKTNKARLHDPVKKIHHVGQSAVLTIDKVHVRRLKIDDWTFFIQRPIKNGIKLEMKRFQEPFVENKYEQDYQTNSVDGELERLTSHQPVQ